MSNGLSIRPQTEIYREPPRSFAFTELCDMADAVARSGLYKMNGAQVLTLMMLCEAQGMHPGHAVMRYHVFDGKVSMRSDAMLAAFQQAGGRVEWTKDTLTECEAIFHHPVYCPKGQKMAFTMDDAKRAKLDGKDNWRNHPRPMLRSRVITNGIRMVLPGVIMGIYTPDEVEEFAPQSPPPRQIPARRPAENHPPVAETVQDLRTAAQQAAVSAPAGEPTPPREASTEWGQWIADALSDFNLKLAKASYDNPKDLKLQQNVKPQQVINAVLTAAIKMEAIVEQAILNEKGTRDKAKIATTMAELWENEPELIPQLVGDYLAGKMVELLPYKDAVQTAQGELAGI